VTGDQSLHQAALLVKGAELNLNRMLDEIQPLLEQYAAEHIAMGKDATQEAIDRHEIESGWRALMDNCWKLHQLLEEPDEIVDAIIRASWFPEAAALVDVSRRRENLAAPVLRDGGRLASALGHVPGPCGCGSRPLCRSP
jgi:hypothetical protein